MPTERPTGPLLGEYQPATAKFRCGFRCDPFAVASHDTERFVPTMSTDFLVRIGELVTEALTARSA